MKVKYSPDFKEAYDELPQSIQRQFQIIDAKVMKGHLPPEKQGWMYFADLNGHYCAFGNYRAKENVFYWIGLVQEGDRPIIF